MICKMIGKMRRVRIWGWFCYSVWGAEGDGGVESDDEMTNILDSLEKC